MWEFQGAGTHIPQQTSDGRIPCPDLIGAVKHTAVLCLTGYSLKAKQAAQPCLIPWERFAPASTPAPACLEAMLHGRSKERSCWYAFCFPRFWSLVLFNHDACPRKPWLALSPPVWLDIGRLREARQAAHVLLAVSNLDEVLPNPAHL